ncbi:hypothetical protein V1527DRAFT_477411 [Lipomyces starkeyi]
MEKVQPESLSAQPMTNSAVSPQLQTEPKTESSTQQMTQPMTQPAAPANTQPAVFYPPPPQPAVFYPPPTQQANTVLGSPQSPLPPNHPCYRGHIIDSKFTPCGIAWAILCFPWGLICLFNDRRKYCIQCGQVFQ